MDRTETPALGESRRHQLSPSLQRPRRFSTLPVKKSTAPRHLLKRFLVEGNAWQRRRSGGNRL
jgi:hypothetical protein